MTASEAFQATLRLLARQDRSETDLARRLRRRGFSEESITDALARCRELGYLDDNRFALEKARSLLKGGRAVGPRLLSDLLGHGISEETARGAISEASVEFPEGDVLERLLGRRFIDFRWDAADDRQRQRVVNYLMRRGFPLSLVLSYLREKRG